MARTPDPLDLSASTDGGGTIPVNPAKLVGVAVPAVVPPELAGTGVAIYESSDEDEGVATPDRVEVSPEKLREAQRIFQKLQKKFEQQKLKRAKPQDEATVEYGPGDAPVPTATRKSTRTPQRQTPSSSPRPGKATASPRAKTSASPARSSVREPSARPPLPPRAQSGNQRGNSSERQQSPGMGSAEQWTPSAPPTSVPASPNPGAGEGGGGSDAPPPSVSSAEYYDIGSDDVESAGQSYRPRGVSQLRRAFERTSSRDSRADRSRGDPDRERSRRYSPVTSARRFRSRRTASPILPFRERRVSPDAEVKGADGGGDAASAAQRAELEQAARAYQQHILTEATLHVSAASASAEDAKRQTRKEAEALVQRIGRLAEQQTSEAAARMAEEAKRCQAEVDAANARADRRESEARERESERIAALESQARAYQARLDEALKAKDAEAGARVAEAQSQVDQAKREMSDTRAAAQQAVESVREDARRAAEAQAAMFSQAQIQMRMESSAGQSSQVAQLQAQFQKALIEERELAHKRSQEMMNAMAESARDQQAALVAAMSSQFEKAMQELKSQRDDLSGQLRAVRARSIRPSSPKRSAAKLAALQRASSRPPAERQTAGTHAAGSGGDRPPSKGGAGKTTDGTAASVPASGKGSKASAKRAASVPPKQDAAVPKLPTLNAGAPEFKPFAHSMDGGAVGAGGGGDAAPAAAAEISFISASPGPNPHGGIGSWDEVPKGPKVGDDFDPPDDDGDDDDWWDENEGWEEDMEEEEPVTPSSVSSIKWDSPPRRADQTGQSEVDSLRSDVARLEGRIESLLRAPKARSREKRKDAKESDKLTMNDLSGKDKFPEWWTSARQATVGCSFGDPDGAFIWFLEIEEKSLEELADPGKKPKLDAKLCTAGTNAAKAQPRIHALISQDEENRRRMDPPQLQRGRQVMKIILTQHKSREGTGKLYNIKDLFAVKLKGTTLDYLRQYRTLYNKIEARCRGAVDDETKEFLYFEQVEKHPALKDEIRDYKKDKNSKDPEKVASANLDRLREAVDEVLLEEDHRLVREAQERAIRNAGGASGTAAPAPTKKKRKKTKGKGKGGGGGGGGDKGKGKGKGKSGGGGDASPTKPKPKAKAKSKGKGRGKGKGKTMPRPAAPATMPKDCCAFFYVHGTCRNGDDCPEGRHARPNAKDRGRPAAPAPKQRAGNAQWRQGSQAPGSINKPCRAETEKPGSCEFGPYCAYKHAEAAAPATGRRRRGRKGQA